MQPCTPSRHCSGSSIDKLRVRGHSQLRGEQLHLLCLARAAAASWVSAWAEAPPSASLSCALSNFSKMVSHSSFCISSNFALAKRESTAVERGWHCPVVKPSVSPLTVATMANEGWSWIERCSTSIVSPSRAARRHASTFDEGVCKIGVLECPGGKTSEKGWLRCGGGEDKGQKLPQRVKGRVSSGCIFLRWAFPASSGLPPEIIMGPFWRPLIDSMKWSELKCFFFSNEANRKGLLLPVDALVDKNACWTKIKPVQIWLGSLVDENEQGLGERVLLLQTLAETFPNHVDGGGRPTGTFFQQVLHRLDHTEANSAVIWVKHIERGEICQRESHLYHSSGNEIVLIIIIYKLWKRIRFQKHGESLPKR